MKVIRPSTLVRPTAAPNRRLVRWYRGESGEMVPRSELDPETARREAALLAIAQPKADAIQEQHFRLPTIDRIPEASLRGHLLTHDGSKMAKDQLELDMRRKRLIYRSKQRGWLEVDLLLGTWASENVPTLTTEGLDHFEDFVNLETIDIYNIITLRTVPEHLRSDPMVQQIQEWAKSHPLGKANIDAYKQRKQQNNLI